MAEDIRDEELYAYTIARLLEGVRHVAVGMASPIPATGALLMRELSGGTSRVSILGSPKSSFWTNGGTELFDLAARGGIDAFFLSGGQIDGSANVNLVGVGDYPHQKVRWSGSFGSAYLYFLVPRVILFRWEHSRRTLVDKVDFISAPGTSEPGIYRPGGPYALMTNLCLFMFNREEGRFHLSSIHPGHSLEEVRDNTGFDFQVPDEVPVTPAPSPDILSVMRETVGPKLVPVYPLFATQVFGYEQDQQISTTA